MKKTLAKQTHTFFWFPVKDIKISDNFSNPKVHKIVLGFSYHRERYTPPYHLAVNNPLVKDVMNGKSICGTSPATPGLVKTLEERQVENYIFLIFVKGFF